MRSWQIRKITRRSWRVAPVKDRRGSVLLVVIGLLGILLLIGFLFFSFAAYEQSGAQTFSEGAKVRTPLNADLYEFAMRQLIVGADDQLTQSALHANPYTVRNGQLQPDQFGRHSMLANMYGTRGRHPYSSAGIHLTTNDATGTPTVNGVPSPDMDRDNAADALLDGRGNPTTPTVGNFIDDRLEFNFSPVTRQGYNRLSSRVFVPTDPSAGVDYTYPDINNLFLSHEYVDPKTNQRIVIPSFHRWQLLRASGSGYITNWPIDASTATRVLRPHPNHMIPGATPTAIPRFLSAPFGGANPFPFALNPSLLGGYDTDNDRDNVFEGIWLDLDYPPIEMPDGRFAIPLFSFTVRDLDGLLNANIHGNVAGLNPAALVNQVALASFPASVSNLGLSPAAINPFWAMNAEPSSATAAQLEQYRQFFGGSNPASKIETANLDQMALVVGRGQFNSGGTLTDALVGRRGDRAQLLNFLNNRLARNLPKPGVPNLDDNNNRTEGEAVTWFNGAGYYGARFPGTTTSMNLYPNYGAGPWPFIHPLDYTGRGLAQIFHPAGDASAYVQYGGYHTLGNVRWGAGAGGQLMVDFFSGTNLLPGNASNQLVDEEWETILELGFESTADQIFGPEEIEWLQRSIGDPDYAQIASRIRALAPLNLDLDANAGERRKQFTTISSDRTQFNIPFSSVRYWEFNADIDADSDDTNNDGIPDSDANGDGFVDYTGLEFPAVSVSTRGTLLSHEAIRPELRKLLQTEIGSNNTSGLQLRWNINKFVSSQYNDTPASFNGWSTGTGMPIQTTYLAANFTPYPRGLTPHPTSLAGTAITAATSPALNPSSAGDQEYWARRDRQQMCRDIYTMLYLYGGGQPTVDYATTSNLQTGSLPTPNPRPVHTNEQLREMAQFAVNVVDALDPDNVITKFEYDCDLSDGWNLDDNPFTAPAGSEPNVPVGADDIAMPTVDRGIVYGVEAQELAIAEALVIKHRRVRNTANLADINHPATELDDQYPVGAANPNPNRYYGYVELQNVTPLSVPLNNETWQVARVVTDAGGNVTLDRRCSITAGGTVSAGQRYVIGTRTHESVDVDGGGNPLPSLLRVDPNYDPAVGMAVLQTIAPATGILDLDLVSQNDIAKWRFSELSGNADVAPVAPPSSTGDFIHPEELDTAVTLVLRRRLHPLRNAPVAPALGTHDLEEADNPFVEVDRVVVNVRRLAAPSQQALRDPTDPALMMNPALNDIQPALGEIFSSERTQPLDRNSLGNYNPQGIVSNSLGMINTRTNAAGGVFTAVQPHFDRDYSSVMELLSLPLYGPDKVTDLLVNTSSGQIVGDLDSDLVPTATQYRHRTAQALILHSNERDDRAYDINGDGSVILTPVPSNTPTEDALRLDNHWHRLLEFLEVTSRTHEFFDANGNQTLKPNFSSPRVPGLINMNALRHRGVFYSLLDDTNQFALDPNPNFLAVDVVEGSTNRDWYNEMLVSRDGAGNMGINAPNWRLGDPLVPGSLESRPFRGMSFAARGNQSLDDTLLRVLPRDADTITTPATNVAPEQQRRLFEVGTAAQHQTPNATVNYHTRHRILSKIQPNTTTRSHVFGVWLTVKYFQAVKNGTRTDPLDNSKQIDAYQIGDVLQPLNGSPTGLQHRYFSVIDRSPTEKVFNAQTGVQNIDSLILFQRTIE